MERGMKKEIANLRTKNPSASIRKHIHLNSYQWNANLSKNTAIFSFY